MNQLSLEQRARIICALVEGNSMRAVSRMTGTHRDAIFKLLADLGRACSVYQNRQDCDDGIALVKSKATAGAMVHDLENNNLTMGDLDVGLEKPMGEKKSKK